MWVCVSQSLFWKHNEFERQPTLWGLLQSTVRLHVLSPLRRYRTWSTSKHRIVPWRSPARQFLCRSPPRNTLLSHDSISDTSYRRHTSRHGSFWTFGKVLRCFWGRNSEIFLFWKTELQKYISLFGWGFVKVQFTTHSTPNHDAITSSPNVWINKKNIHG